MTALSDGDDLLKELFGNVNVIFTYTDAEAVQDGVLIPFVAKNGDTGYRITSNAWHELTDYHRCRGYPQYSENDFYRFFFAELLPLAPYAIKKWNNGGILMSDFDFKVGEYKAGAPNVLWYEPNHNSPVSVTMMLPDDH